VLELRGHRSSITALTISFCNNYASSADNDGILMLWELESGHCLHQLQNKGNIPVTSLALNYGGTMCLATHLDGNIQLFRILANEISTYKQFEDLNNRIITMDF